MEPTPAAASDAAIAEPTPPVPTTRQRAPATANPLRTRPRTKPVPSNMSPSSVPSGRSSTALHEPAISTVGVTASTRPTVVTLCGIVTSAPRTLVRRKSARKNAG